MILILAALALAAAPSVDTEGPSDAPAELEEDHEDAEEEDETPAAPVDTSAIAVLPFKAPENALGEDGLDLLAGSLAAELASVGGVRVISPEELRALMQNEAHRQLLGGDGDEALREATGALGAGRAVAGTIKREDARLVWRTTLLRPRDATVLETAEVSAPSLGELAAQSDVVALELLGREEEADDPGATAERMGFVDAGDAEHFHRFRSKHPAWGADEALTEYILQHNVESARLAVVEAALFHAAGAMFVLGAASSTLSLLLVALLPLGPLSVPFSVGSLALLGGGSVLLAGAVVLAVLDGLNVGRRPIRKQGCCRDDARILDEVAERETPQKVSALSILLGGAASSAGMFAALCLFASASMAVLMGQDAFGVPRPTLGYYSSPAYGAAAMVFLTSYCCTLGTVLVPCLVGVPLGTALLLWPASKPVDGMEALE